MDSAPYRKHLKRLNVVWKKQPVYFVTCCIRGRYAFLANGAAFPSLVEEWDSMGSRHGWMVGRYVVMPDHVHFFVTPVPGTVVSLSRVIGSWKEWTAKRIHKIAPVIMPLWQAGFFDHLIRSRNSYIEKWAYVRANPVRAGFVHDEETWPWQGGVDFE